MPRKRDRLVKKLKKQRRIRNAYALANWIEWQRSLPEARPVRKKKRGRR